MDNPARAAIFRRMEHDLIIVGGGLNGPALALAAARAGLTSVVLDALPDATRSDDNFDGRGYALALASQRMLAALDLWDGLAPDAQPMRQIKVSDGRVGEAQVFLGLHFDSAELEEGPMGYMLEDRFLRRALMAATEASPLITPRAGARVTAQSTRAEGATVTLDDGEVLKGRLLVGADGRSSGTAARAGIRRTGWGYGQTALVCAISHEKPHEGIAHQLFLPSGPLAILPLPGNRSSIVWSETEQRARAINALGDAEYLQVLRPRFGDFLGEIGLAGQRFTYPLNLTLANRFVDTRLALVGDAAHGMHPIAGQGLNAGLRDVAALAHVLSHANTRGEDIASEPVLARYQSWRRFDTASLAASTDLFNRLFSNDNPLLRLARDAGMAAVNAVPGLRRGIIREAAGLTGDLPDLMRG
ncbi:UbiH/UbiF/VisC/COQ6 family ubiquinone biosynthesis hydroxylase [Sagittula stellata]|uniref:Ubiquinone biosynthesis hydroxylase, UbiH/UbiF/VisC/COQ6 family protein n=1 Tax=Sagittula stellata (strain ATCC 700073 / DSM 11524 / E-37) TaxID=388399 RepID=A3JYH0_SAGS3|nr:UbiH/UbiF/VisC/COQ6 family ubiquinone biosynthesis hydroxylase [Sagittula stellata]EBA10556.1 ubiquinone biosynthesis hydroxylase, UbiH/UbiF/VisC/COQ6 family protein [Sagittula stellata E-37]